MSCYAQSRDLEKSILHLPSETPQMNIISKKKKNQSWLCSNADGMCLNEDTYTVAELFDEFVLLM